MDPLPNFFIAGVPKAGTTSLYHYLDQHPQIYMSPIKEPSYFASELRPENFDAAHRAWMEEQVEEVRRYIRGAMGEKRFGGPVVDWDDYRGLFRNAGGKAAVGEASVSYLWSKTAARNIAGRMPHAKIVLMLRDPAERAYSQYLQAVSEGRVRRSFRAEVRKSMEGEDRPFGVLNPFLEYGNYFQQIKRFRNAFPSSQIRVYLYEDYRRDARPVLRDLFGFLNVDDTFTPDLSEKFLQPRVPRFIGATYFLRRWGLWRRVRDFLPEGYQRATVEASIRPRSAVAMRRGDRQQMSDYYREDIQRLAGLLNRDLGEWLRV